MRQPGRPGSAIPWRLGRSNMASGRLIIGQPEVDASTFTFPVACLADRKKPALEFSNLLETPERAATLACSNTIKPRYGAPVNTKKPLRATVFSRRNSSRSVNKRHANAKGRHANPVFPVRLWLTAFRRCAGSDSRSYRNGQSCLADQLKTYVAPRFGLCRSS